MLHIPRPNTPSSPIPDTLQTILSHRLCRAFLPDPLRAGTLETLLTAASSGSTSSLYQTWSVVAIQDPKHKASVAILAGNQDFIRQAPLFLVFCPNLRRLHTLSTYYGQQPARALDSMDMFIMSTVDATIAGQNVAIAAQGLGLGICYVAAIRNNAAEMCKLLNLPPLTWDVFGMAVGYPDLRDRKAGRRVKPRLPMRDIVYMERWAEEGEQMENVHSYDRALGEFYVEEGKNGRMGWGEFVAAKVAPFEQDGRERIRAVIEGQGFKLE
ncbi:hypothetical protein ASPVEDRAFT_44665 [Aspergillus versicolor CBS 583.65]|uniref:Nitroreductase domain-containing protein n=1 Tax=Aspergillus versicolor CBS 583.65 TaxID=1036611 RepID=A0A1L9PUE6_ASPVE|nr:uncharacterized protein ASPVEDRAFT_44665 [Aspergillus versicolor CBS 583.65]OJJ05141.1 hypothetical protein ASPVEDRAFT_44665 [Aspergillus versicolor CBS 583.65]